jgi:hypothetical protein
LDGLTIGHDVEHRAADRLTDLAESILDDGGLI